MMPLIRLLTELLQLFNSHDSRIVDLESRITYLEDQIGKIAVLEEQVMALKEQVQELVAKVAELQAAISDETGELKAAFEALMAKVDELTAKVGELEGLDIAPEVAAVSDSINRIKGLSDLSIKPDTEIPSTPTSVAGTATADSVSLTWGASTDNVGVVGYEIFQNGEKVGDSAGTVFTATGLTAETAYVFSVRAKDNAGNFSAVSDPVEVITTAA